MNQTTVAIPPAKHNMAASIGRNTLFGIVSNLTQVGTRLVTVPIVIQHLGLDGYGIWNIIMMTATYMRFGSVGVKTAFQKYVAEATGDHDYEKASRLLSTGCALMLALSVAGLIPVMLFSHQIARTAGVPQEFLESSAGAISLLAVIMGMANVGACYEAIVMGGHRIDLVRKFSSVSAVLEAIAIIAVLRLGHGLFAMSVVMGMSELAYQVFCYIVSSRVLPQVQVRLKYVTKDVLRELIRFAGSYQMVNLLEVVYVSLLPFAVLKAFGASTAGVYAVVTRIVSSASYLQEAFLPPILSSGTMVFASGSTEKVQALFVKAFKVTLTLSLFPYGFIAIFGGTITYAWTGQTDNSFAIAFWLISLSAVFKAFSLLSLILYRVSGKGFLDNIRQVLRIVAVGVLVVTAPAVGFQGVLIGLAVTEFVGMVFMLFALRHTFELFRVRYLLPDAMRVTFAAASILGLGVLASFIPLPTDAEGRRLATLRLAEICLACSLVAWPLLVRTGAVTRAEGKALLGSFSPNRSRAGTAAAGEV